MDLLTWMDLIPGLGAPCPLVWVVCLGEEVSRQSCFWCMCIEKLRNGVEKLSLRWQQTAAKNGKNALLLLNTHDFARGRVPTTVSCL